MSRTTGINRRAGAAAELLAAALLPLLAPPSARADEFRAMPGLWRITYEVEGAAADDVGSHEPRVSWHCLHEASDPWIVFAQLETPAGMTCKATSQDRNSTSLRWQWECRGPGPEESADVVEMTGAVIFDSPQHYRGWVKLTGTLLGYPLLTKSKLEGTRKAACTSPLD